jgi:predicted ABC-type exoprotein transport system permease subunit
MNQCENDEKERRKEKDYKNVSEIFLSTIIIAVIIIIIIIVNIIIIIIIIEENEYENCVNHLENFDTLFICFVEFFASVSSLKKED